MAKLDETYKDRGVRALIINVLEDLETATSWAKKIKWTLPMLLDSDGEVAKRYAPDVLPDLPREEVPIASNLIIDRQGKIQFYSLLDSRHFDAKLIAVRARLDSLLARE